MTLLQTSTRSFASGLGGLYDHALIRPEWKLIVFNVKERYTTGIDISIKSHLPLDYLEEH